MSRRTWLALLAFALSALLLVAVAAASAPNGGESGPQGLLETIQSRIASIRDAFEEWRRAPYERIEREFTTRQDDQQHHIAQLEVQLDALRSDLTAIQLTPGPPGPGGPMGVQGPLGPRGPQGLPGNLQLAGEGCPASQAVSGFDAFGNMLCTVMTTLTVAASGGEGLDCRVANFATTADLRRCDLRREPLGGRDLSFATMVKADLRGASLQDTNFRGADLRDAELTGSDLTNVNLAYANLTFGRLGSVRVEGGDWSGAILRRAELSLSRIEGVRMQGADLSDASLILSQHERSDYTRANLSGADLRQSVFTDSTLFLAITSGSLEQARMINTICPDGSNSNGNNNSCVGHTRLR